MAHKGSHYQVASAIHLVEVIKDHLLTSGWTLTGPTDTLSNRQAQDDEHAHILGWFLHSDGESGNADNHMHLLCGDSETDRNPGTTFSYLKTGVAIGAGTFELPTGEGSKWSAGDRFKVGAELCIVGSVTGDDLTGCTRGYNGTVDALHYANDVVAKATTAVPHINMFAFRDFANPIAQSTSAGALAEETAASPVPGMSVYAADKFQYGTLIKVRDGAEADKMRWVKTDPGDGTFTYTSFLLSPGTANIDMLSAGFFPTLSRKQALGPYSAYKSATLRNYNSTTLTDLWIYSSKEGFALVVLSGATYSTFYFGAYIPLNTPLTTAAEGQAGSGAAILAGDQTIKVSDVGLFIVDATYRILGQDARDWDDNYDQSASTYMGATGAGEWDDLDCDELAYECVVVQSVNVGASTVTFTTPLNYAYRAGAVIGADPRPIVTYVNGGYSSVVAQLATTSSQRQNACAFHAVGAPYFLQTHPAHRVRWRCGLDNIPTDKPWAGEGSRDAYNQKETVFPYLLPADVGLLDNEENYAGRLPLVPFSLGWYDGITRTQYNGWKQARGVIPFVRKMYDNLSGTSEDTISVLWNGSYETFRIFYDVSGQWIAVGPEIA